MSDEAPPEEIVLFGQQIPVEDGRFAVHQTLTVAQARRLEREFDEATSVQSAVRMAVETGIEERESRVTDVEIREIVGLLREIREAVGGEAADAADG